ncbi:reverse transcriptase domain-containing protein [Tanacetum coccineum]
MRTRSSSNLVGESSPNPTTSNPKRRNRRRSKQPFSLEESPVDTMADQRTMAELLRAPTEGYAEAIVVPPILAEHFELKHSLINMMTSDQFFGLEKDNPHDHIRWFNKITSTIKYKDVPNSAIKLMLFPFSLAGAARRWLEKEPPRSILTWEDLVSKFINEFFPPSRTTNLRNEISNFEQRFGESFHEAWDRYKDLLRACPHHGFTELHQLDTFYNALNPTDQDSLNSAAGGNLLERSTQDVLTIIENKSKVRNSRTNVNQQTSVVTIAMTDILKQFQATPPLAFVKAAEEIYVTCDGAYPYYQEFSPLMATLSRNIGIIFKDTLQQLRDLNSGGSSLLSHPGRPFLRTARALIDVHGEEMILRDGNERLTLNMRHDTSSYSTQPHQELINMINVYNVSHEEILKDLFATNHQSGNPTFSSHTDLTSPEVIDPSSGNPTPISKPVTKSSSSPTLISFEESDLIWEEFEAYLASDSFPQEFDFLPSPECDSVLYEDFSEVDALSLTNNEDKNVKKPTNASLILEDFNPPLYELPFHKEVPGLGALLSISRIFEASRALGFCPSFTRASHPQLHFGNPISKSYRLTRNLRVFENKGHDSRLLDSAEGCSNAWSLSRSASWEAIGLVLSSICLAKSIGHLLSRFSCPTRDSLGVFLVLSCLSPEVPVVPADPIVIPEVGTVSVVSPSRVLDLVDYSPSSSSDPLEDSLPPAPDVPLVSLEAFRRWRSTPLSTPYPPTTSESSLGSSSERSLDSSSHFSRSSRKRCRSLTALVPLPNHVSRSIAPTHGDLLPSRKRFRDSYSSKDSGEEHMEVDTADTEAVADVGISEGVVAHPEDGVGMGFKIPASDDREDDEEFKAEASAADTREIVVDPLAIGDSSESSK